MELSQNLVKSRSWKIWTQVLLNGSKSALLWKWQKTCWTKFWKLCNFHILVPPPSPQLALAGLDTSSTRRSRFDLGRAELEKRRSWEWEWIMPFLWLSKKGGFWQFHWARILLGPFFYCLFFMNFVLNSGQNASKNMQKSLFLQPRIRFD